MEDGRIANEQISFSIIGKCAYNKPGITCTDYLRLHNAPTGKVIFYVRQYDREQFLIEGDLVCPHVLTGITVMKVYSSFKYDMEAFNIMYSLDRQSWRNITDSCTNTSKVN